MRQKTERHQGRQIRLAAARHIVRVSALGQPKAACDLVIGNANSSARRRRFVANLCIGTKCSGAGWPSTNNMGY